MFFGSLFCTHVSMSISPCLSYMFFGTFILFEMLCAVWYHSYNLMNVTGFPLVHFLHYENRFVCYRKLTSRSCPVLHCHIFSYTYTLIFYSKKMVPLISIFLSKLDHWPLIHYIYFKTILMWKLVSIWFTNATHCL